METVSSQTEAPEPAQPVVNGAKRVLIKIHAPNAGKTDQHKITQELFTYMNLHVWRTVKLYQAKVISLTTSPIKPVKNVMSLVRNVLVLWYPSAQNVSAAASLKVEIHVLVRALKDSMEMLLIGPVKRANNHSIVKLAMIA